MCQVCNENLLAASQSALNLANAAKVLDGINRRTESGILAKAAADLFTEVLEAAEAAVDTPKTEAPAVPKRGVHIDEASGVFYFNGTPVARFIPASRL